MSELGGRGDGGDGNDERPVERPSWRPPPARARIIQRPSGALLCTACGGYAPPMHFPLQAETYRAKVEAFVTSHENCALGLK